MKNILLLSVLAISTFAQTTGASPETTPNKPKKTGTAAKKAVHATPARKTQGEPSKAVTSAAPANSNPAVSTGGSPKTGGATAVTSPTPVNVQPQGASAAVPVQVVAIPVAVNGGKFAPGLYAAASPYLLAQHTDNSYVTADNPARQGEVIILWGTGFLVPGASPLTDAVTVTIGGQPAAVDSVGAVAGGLVQINVHVPSLDDGDSDVVATVFGVSTQTAGNMVPIGGNPVKITTVSSPGFVASGDTADVQYVAEGANVVELSTPGQKGAGKIVIAQLSASSGTFSFAVKTTRAYMILASNGTFTASKAFTINSGKIVCSPYAPPSSDGRTASIAFYNDGSGSVDVRLYDPADPARPFSGQVYTIPQGANYFPGSAPIAVGGDWGVRAGDTCPVSVGSSARYDAGHDWQASGNSAQGVTKQSGDGTR